MNLVLKNTSTGEVRKIEEENANYYYIDLIPFLVIVSGTCFAWVFMIIGFLSKSVALVNMTLYILNFVKIGILIYMFCFFITLGIGCSKKQFKPFGSILIYRAISTFVGGVLLEVNPLLGFLVLTAFQIFNMYMEFKYIKHLNYWSYNSYIENGYEAENGYSNEENKNFIETAKTKKKPGWLLFI